MAYDQQLADAIAEIDRLRAENERLRKWLAISLDAYEDEAMDENIGKPGHFTTEARKAIGVVEQKAGEPK